MKPYTVTIIEPNLSSRLRNILKEKFNPEEPDAVWCSDITYIWTYEGLLLVYGTECLVHGEPGVERGNSGDRLPAPGKPPCYELWKSAGAADSGSVDVHLFLLPAVLLLLIISSTVWGEMLNAVFLFSRDASIVMDVFDMPMTLFSGTRVPVDSFPCWAKIVSIVFMLTYCIHIIRFALNIQKSSRGLQAEILVLLTCLGVMTAVTVFLIGRVERHNRETGELQFY